MVGDRAGLRRQGYSSDCKQNQWRPLFHREKTLIKPEVIEWEIVLLL